MPKVSDAKTFCAKSMQNSNRVYCWRTTSGNSVKKARVHLLAHWSWSIQQPLPFCHTSATGNKSFRTSEKFIGAVIVPEQPSNTCCGKTPKQYIVSPNSLAHIPHIPNCARAGKKTNSHGSIFSFPSIACHRSARIAAAAAVTSNQIKYQVHRHRAPKPNATKAKVAPNRYRPPPANRSPPHQR